MLLRNGVALAGMAYFGGAGVGIPLPPAAVLAGSAGALALTEAEGADPELEPPQPVMHAASARPASEIFSANKPLTMRIRFMT